MFQGTGALAFNATFYLQTNPDVFQAIQNGTFQGSALDHFVQFGQFEGRDPNAFFDTEYYLAENPDVLVAIADPANPSVTSAFQHFVMFGSDEGVVRAPSAAFASFNPDTYLAQNPDLQAAFGNLTGEAQDRALFAHFVEFGVNENRPGSGVVIDTTPGVPGQTFSLTTGIDALNGTNGNDVFVGVIDGTDNTIQTGDSINGGSGTDTLRVVATADGTTGLVSLTAVERVEVQAVGATTDVDVNLTNSTGVQTLALKSSDGNATFAGVNAAAAISIANSSGDVAVAYAAGVAQAAGGQNVSLTNVDGSTVTVTGVGATSEAAFNVIATGENTLADLTTTGELTTLNISGSGSFELVADVAATVETVNAAANSGGVELNLSLTDVVSVTGGSGDDRFVFEGSLTAKDTVVGGAGFDTVAVEGGTFLNATTNAAFNALDGIERLEFTGATGAVLTGKFLTNEDITNILFNTGGADIINVAGSARTYEFGADNGDAATFNMKAGATELNVDYLGETGAGNNAVTTALNVNLAAGSAPAAVSTINIDSIGDIDAADNATGIISARSGSTINITGDADLTVAQLVNVGGAAGVGFTIDASAFEGDLNIRGSAEGDTITLGAGDDLVRYSAGDSGDVTSGEIVNFDVITGFQAGAGNDVLSYVGAGPSDTFFSVTAAQQTDIDDNAATLLEATVTAITAGDAGWTVFEFGGEAFAVYNVADDVTFDAASDVIVQLAGVDVADLVAGNFTAVAA